VAIATPPGASALGVVRLSGPDAVPIAGALLRARSALESQSSHTIRKVHLVNHYAGTLIDEAMCVVMRAPRSPTGEDVVELSCHGGPALLAMVVAELCRAGARLAMPGEFTRRAFVNGRVDLARAEAVALLISARTERAVTLAARALEGGLGRQIEALREALVDLIARLEVGLDFPDDEVSLASVAARARVEGLAHEVNALLAAAHRGRLVHDGVTIALVGRPNAGKSSLLNALLGRERAIVAPTPGTTRDVVEGTLEIAGVPVRLLDTAGIGQPGDPVEAEGMRRTNRAIEESDLVVLIVDGSVPPSADPHLEGALAGRPVLAVRSKCDLPLHPGVAIGTDRVAVSATTGSGLAALLTELAAEVSRVAGIANDESQIAATLRQMEGLEGIGRSLQTAAGALAELPLEVALVDLRDALVTASTLLGCDVGDAVLDRIFATFCVGK
jgi:tRNA modification GTPase